MLPARLRGAMPRGPLPRLLLAYATLYAGYGTVSPFLPAFLAERGLDPAGVGLVLAAGTGMRLAAGPLAGRLADRLGAIRAVLGLAALLSAGGTLAYLAGHGLGALLVLGALQAAATAPLAPLADALALPAAAAGRFSYGTIRGAGSAAFIAGSLAAGQIVTRAGLAATLAAGAGCFALMAAAVARLPAPPAPAPEARPGARALLASRPFRRLVLVAGLVIGSHAVHDAFAVIRWRAAGLSPGTASLLWAEAVAAEVAVFCGIGPALLGRLGPAGAIALAAGAGVLRWSVAAVTAALPALAATQALHGLTFALLHLAAMRVLAGTVPPALAATAQTLYGTLGLGLASVLATLAAGPLYAAFGPGAFWAMAALAAAALPLARGLPGTSVQPDQTA
ncbi:putative 3-phenylpropionic acid transporter [Methylobacterium crusticola]|uniref:3-phenylpropionic acid transporter n=1 Tax=Methylobacterium crusticola TaxID=1697972 RepID=A0ABQ4RA89_9HYPH|nr:MFS transporter [Methylobacterium crusticola]GJD53617.1 putative 3-phenylpropionic acid transporter [Methylobacterium crusticola]